MPGQARPGLHPLRPRLACGSQQTGTDSLREFSSCDSYQDHSNNASQAKHSTTYSPREVDDLTLNPVLTIATPPLKVPTHDRGDDLQKLLDSARPHHMPEGIPVPQVDLDVLFTQHIIFKDMWPVLTEVAWDTNPVFCELYHDIKAFNLPNFMGARRTVPSALKLEAWETALVGYHDAEICFFLRYGWPVGYHSSSPPTSIERNHPSAQAYEPHIIRFLEKEQKYNAIVGPFSQPPFTPWCRRSPIMTRPKKDTDARRIIIDLSFPHGLSVNDAIDIQSIYGRNTKYTLPSITDLIAHVQKLGPGCWLWKADLARAYRQFRVDPIDTPLLGMGLKQDLYLDLCPSFGCRSSSACCQRASSAVTYLMAKQDWTVLAFLDDFAGIQSTKSTAEAAYESFLSLTTHLGLELASDKCEKPTQAIQWLGYEVNTITMSVTIPKDKMLQVLHECKLWSNRSRASKTMIQSLVGKLLHIATCIQHARKFVSRILSTLRYMVAESHEWTTLSSEFKLDVKWFHEYASLSNGIELISPPTTYFYIECDSSLTGGGGNSNLSFYSWAYAKQHVDKYAHIHQLEAINLLVAYRTLTPKRNTQGATIVMVTDNLASSYALTTGRTKDLILAACSRELWLEAARAQHNIAIEHTPGDHIPLADALSRQHSDRQKAIYAQKLTQNRGLTKLNPQLSGYVFFNDNI